MYQKYTTQILNTLYSKRESNSHEHYCSEDFKSAMSTIPSFEQVGTSKLLSRTGTIYTTSVYLSFLIKLRKFDSNSVYFMHANS